MWNMELRDWDEEALVALVVQLYKNKGDDGSSSIPNGMGYFSKCQGDIDENKDRGGDRIYKTTNPTKS